jgi:aminoglycoside phosphotransferase (APT) family kinase protein
MAISRQFLAPLIAPAGEARTFKEAPDRSAGRVGVPAAHPGSGLAVSAALRLYLAGLLHISSPRFVQPLVEICDGWEAYSYRFQLQAGRRRLPNLFAGPLMLRIYSSPHGLPRSRREFTLQQHLFARGYPVAEPVLLEESCAHFGGPFLIMHQIGGQCLFRCLLKRPWMLWGWPAQMARAHLQLHRLPIDGFPDPGGSLASRRLDEMRTIIDEYGLDELRPGLNWLTARRPPEPAVPHILHLDFHPLNLMLSRHGSLVVLDWPEAALGDIHADVGTTLALMDSICPEKAWATRLAVRMGRSILRRRYLRAYRREQPLDDGKLAYYRAWATLRRLCWYGRWLAAGGEITGSKPCVVDRLAPAHSAGLARYFRRWTGVSVRLGRYHRV